MSNLPPPLDAIHGFPTLLAVGFSCRALVQSATREGFEVVAADSCGDRDTLDLCKSFLSVDLDVEKTFDSLLDTSRSYDYRVILAGGTEDNGSLLQRLASIDAKVRPNVIAQMREWKNWQRWACDSGIQFPITYSKSDIHKLKMNQRDRRWLVKKTASGGGLGIRIWENAGTGLEDDAAILQEYLRGRSLGVTCLSTNQGNVVLGMAESLPHQAHPWSHFIYRGSCGPVRMSVELESCFKSFAHVVARETGYEGLWQSDFLLSESGLYLLEINPRWTASMELIAIAYDLPLIHWHYHAADFSGHDWVSLVKRVRSARECSNSLLEKQIIYAEEDFQPTLEMLENWWSLRWSNASLDSVGEWYADIPSSPKKIPKGAPICSRIRKI